MRKPWYSSTQLRAAAAVLFVAAASLVVVWQRGAENVQSAAGERRAVSDASSAEVAAAEANQSAADGAAQPPSDPAAVGNAAGSSPRDPVAVGKAGSASREASAAVGRSAAAESPRQALTTKPAPREADLQQSSRRTSTETARVAEKMADAPAPGANVIPPAAPPQASRSALSAPLRLEGAVVTGAAAAPAAAMEMAKVAPIELVRTDTAASVITKTYRLPDGILVTLTESPAVSASFSGKGLAERERRLQAQGTSRASTAAAPPLPRERRDSTIQPPMLSIRWTDSAANRLYILSGPVSQERLEAIRKQIERR
jgi:hypothetical protein